ncbi:MAG: hypothetical protein MZV65_29870 [Chromatiales bacterium]|nr:hypothetical protein [Chromatiales bacterium]
MLLAAYFISTLPGVRWREGAPSSVISGGDDPAQLPGAPVDNVQAHRARQHDMGELYPPFLADLGASLLFIGFVWRRKRRGTVRVHALHRTGSRPTIRVMAGFTSSP